MMAKKRKQQPVQEVQETQVIESAIEEPKPVRQEARPCSLCQNYRPHGKNYSRVYCTRGRVRYCKCDFCGNTWSQEWK
jgi:hypothetical protein